MHCECLYCGASRCEECNFSWRQPSTLVKSIGSCTARHSELHAVHRSCTVKEALGQSFKLCQMQKRIDRVQRKVIATPRIQELLRLSFPTALQPYVAKSGIRQCLHTLIPSRANATIGRPSVPLQDPEANSGTCIYMSRT